MDANKHKQGRAEALALAQTVAVLHVAKGQKVVTIDRIRDAPSDDQLVSYLLGPTGNLRAPTIRRGHTLYVGFNPHIYRTLLE